MNKLELDLVRQALSSEDFEKYLMIARSLAENSRSIPAKVADGVELSDILLELTANLAPRLATAEGAASTDRREKNAARLAWLHKASPKSILQDIERMQWYNERIITFAAERTAAHLLLRNLLDTHKLAALSVMDRDEQDLGKVSMTFVRRLKAAGLKVECVKDLPNALVAALVELLNGDAERNLADALGVQAQERVREDPAELESSRDALEKQIAALKAELETLSHYQALKAPAPDKPSVHVQPDQWDYEKGDLPGELWSALSEPTQYRFEDRTATLQEESTVLTMLLPGAHDWKTLRDRDTDFEDIALDRLRTAKGGQLNMRDLFVRKTGCDLADVDENVVRVWLFLLAGRQMAPEERDKMFGQQYFDGVIMPISSRTQNMVRVLRWGEAAD